MHDYSAALAIANVNLESNQVSVRKLLNRVPQAFDLSQILNKYTPSAALLDFGDWGSTPTAVADIRSLAPLPIAIVGFGADWTAQKES